MLDLEYIASFNYDVWFPVVSRAIVPENIVIPTNVFFKDVDEDLRVAILSNNTTAPVIKCAIRACNEFIARANCDVFVRLSTRSPKDSPHTNRCMSGEDVFNLLFSSQRVHNDLLNFKNVKIVLIPYRKFHDYNELRVFVFKGKPVAITRCVRAYTRLETIDRTELEKMIHTLVSAFNSTAISTMYDSTYIVDIEVEYNKIHVVELNPYFKHGSTSAGDFDWDADANILFDPSPSRIVFRMK
jgi:hypothetical protein